MKNIFLLLSLTTLLFASQSDLEQRISKIEKDNLDFNYDISELMPILEEVEKKSILDKLNLSPELELRLDKFNYKVGEITGENTEIYKDGKSTGEFRRKNYSKNFNPASSIKFKLNISAKLDNNIDFYGRLTFMNTSQSYQRLCILSRDIKSSQSTSAFDVDLAYLNYKVNNSTDYASTFSFGILPTTSGTPMQFAQDSKRKSMFPALVFDMNTYGAIGTQKLAQDNFLRVILAKAYTMRANFYPYQCNRENIDNATVAGMYYDTKFNFIGKSLLSFGVNLLHDFKAHPYLGPDVTATTSNVLGDMLTYGIGLDIQEVAQKNLTVFAHAALSNPHGNGASDDYQIAANVDQNLSDGLTQSGLVGFSEADYAQGAMLSANGYSFYLGTKYDLNSQLKFGLEYNYGSKYWFSATQGAEDMYNKLATRGHVGETYAIWKFHKNMYTKLGYMHSQEKYTGSGWHFGEPAKKDGTQNVVYLNLKAKF